MVASQVERLMAQKDAKNMIADALFKDGLISKTELDRIHSDNDNILKEQTEALEKEANPEAFKKSRYYRYFDNFESGTGFDLTYRLSKNKKLFKRITKDAHLALKLKKERN